MDKDIATAAVSFGHESAALELAISRARDLQLALQHRDGYWWYTLEANESIGAEYIILTHYLNIVDKDVEAGLLSRMLSQQRSDGTWALYFDGSPDLSTTIECYFALKLSGVSIEAECMKKAREFILECGGLVKARVFTKIHLALFGLVPWSACPMMPVEFILLHPKLPISIYEFSSWARACIVPLLVVMNKKKSIVLPREKHLDELFLRPPTAKCWRYELKQSLLSLDNFFILLDTTLKRLPLPSLRFSKKLAFRRCRQWICDHIEKTEDIYPAMSYAAIALYMMEGSLEHPAIQKSLSGLRSFQQWYRGENLPALSFDRKQSQPAESTLSTICHQQCCISPVWDTPWQMTALLESDVPNDHPKMVDAARWLISKQILTTYGDWSIKNKKARPGGWSFEFNNDYFPDVDDTIQVLMMLGRISLSADEKNMAIERGLEWILSMQCKNGGFGAFDKDNNLDILNKIPFSDHGACIDPPTPDITGRMVELLAQFGYDRLNPVVSKAIAFIQKEQHACGGWWGRWGINYIYGTWCVLSGLEAVGEDFSRPYIQRALNWLKSVQRKNGGFCESPDSYLMGGFVPYSQSTASQTAWAAMALMTEGIDSPELKRAIAYLVDTQRENGSWEEMHHTGTGFPGHFYIRYHGYRYFFPLLAIARYHRFTQRNLIAG